MKSLKLQTLVLALVAARLALPSTAATYRHHYRHRTCGAQRRHNANTGTAVGAVAGGVIGNSASHGGGRLGGTLIGAGVGAVAGHEIGKHSTRC